MASATTTPLIKNVRTLEIDSEIATLRDKRDKSKSKFKAVLGLFAVLLLAGISIWLAYTHYSSGGHGGGGTGTGTIEGGEGDGYAGGAVGGVHSHVKASQTEASAGTDWQEDYDHDLANRSCMITYAVGCGTEKVKDWSCKYCDYVDDFTVIKVIRPIQNTTRVLFGYDEMRDEAVVVMAGSQNLDNYKYNLNFAQVPYSDDYINEEYGCRVHLGFWTAWQDMEERVMEIIADMMEDYPDKPWRIGGHSFGAATTTLMALAVKKKYPERRVVHVGFGQPRLFNSVFAVYFEEEMDQLWRVVNMNDGITQLPSNLMGYHHAGKQVWYYCSETATYYECDGSGEDADCQFVSGSPGDHHMYMDVLSTCSEPLGTTRQQSPCTPVDEMMEKIEEAKENGP